MKIQKLKRQGTYLAIVSVVFFSGCAKKSQIQFTEARVTQTEESAVLQSSSFFPGELAAPVVANSNTRLAVSGGDGGFISGPTKGGTQGDGGAIPAPGGNTPATGTSSTPSTGPVASPVPSSTESTTTSPSTGDSTASSGTSVSPGASSGSEVTSPSISPSPSPAAGSDGGAIVSNPTTGSDSGGTIAGPLPIPSSNPTTNPTDQTFPQDPTSGASQVVTNPSVSPVPEPTTGNEVILNPIPTPVDSSVPTTDVSILPSQGSDGGQINDSGTPTTSDGGVTTPVVTNPSENPGTSDTIGSTTPGDVNDGSENTDVATVTPPVSPQNSGTSPTASGGSASGSDNGTTTSGGGNSTGSDGGNVVTGSTEPTTDVGQAKPPTILEIIAQILESIQQVIAENPPAGGQTPNQDSSHGNNGVGNGEDSAPAGNPAVNDGGGTSPGHPGSSDHGSGHASTGGHSSGGHASTGGHSSGTSTCGSCQCSCNTTQRFKVNLSRVCSVRRSSTESLFFEEAKNPILSVEASLPQNSCEAPKYASFGFTGYPQTKSSTPSVIKLLLKAYSLSMVNLFDGKYTAQLTEFSVQELRKKYPRHWRNALVNLAVCDDTNGNGKCSDELLKNQLSVNSAAFLADRIPYSMTLDVWNGRNLTKATDAEYCEKQYSPLVLDLKGDGIKLSSPRVSFDLNDTGEKVTTGWTLGADDAFLVRDVNRNGRIDNGSELFGSATKLANGSRAANGFEALKELDKNHDGRVDSKDPSWKDLRLWLDKNANGLSEKGEILTMRAAQMESIDLQYIDLMEVDPFGNQTRQRSTFRRVSEGKSTALMVIDVWFNTLVSR